MLDHVQRGPLGTPDLRQTGVDQQVIAVFYQRQPNEVQIRYDCLRRGVNVRPWQGGPIRGITFRAFARLHAR